MVVTWISIMPSLGLILARKNWPGRSTNRSNGCSFSCKNQGSTTLSETTGIDSALQHIFYAA
jgi:hypothetical protein